MRYDGLMDPDELPPAEDASDASLPPWGTGDIVWGVFAVLLAVPVIVGVGAALIVGADVDKAIVAMALSAVLESVVAGAAWWFSVRKYGLRWADLGFRWAPRGRSFFIVAGGVVAGLAIAGGYGAIVEALGLEESLPTTPLFDDESSTTVVALGATLAVLAAPLAEEVFFRGFVFGGLRGRIGVRFAALISAALFMVAHVNPAVFVPIFLIGLLLTWVYAKTGSLWYPILVHLGYNGLVVLITLTT